MNNHTNLNDNDDCPTCYGDSEKHGQIDACSSCEYFDSCRWYIDNPDPCADGKRFSRGHDVSFEAVQFSEQVANIPAPDSDDESESRQTKGKTVFTLDELRRLLEFMLRDIDDYSLAIVECALRTDCTSAADLACVRCFTRGNTQKADRLLCEESADRLSSACCAVQMRDSWRSRNQITHFRATNKARSNTKQQRSKSNGVQFLKCLISITLQ